MKTTTLILLAALAFGGAARAQDLSTDSYDFILAKLASSEGRYDEALSRMERVLEKNPSDPVLQYERALVLIDAGRIERAEAELRKVVAANPDFYDAQRILGRVLLDRAGNDRAKGEEALEHLRAAFRLNPDDLVTGITVSQILVQTNRIADAEKVLAQLVDRMPDHRALNYNYAQILTQLGRGADAKQYLERSVQLDPTFAPAVEQLADLYRIENEWAKAAQIIAPLVAQDPMNLELQRTQAYYWLRALQPEKARESLQALVAADPRDTRSLFYLGEALSDLQQYEEAEKIYRRLLEQQPNDADVLSSFGLVQIGQRKLDEAAKTFRMILDLKDLPANLTTLSKTQLAYIELQKGNLDAAISTAREVLVFNDKPNGQAVNIALEAFKRDKKFAEAVAMLQPLADKYGNDPVVNARLIEYLLRAGEKEKAQQAAATQAKFGTRNTIAAAEAFIQASDYPSAIALIRSGLQSKPDEIDLRFQLGSAYERSGDLASAEKTFLAILEKHPEHAATLNYLGYMWADNNKNLERAQEMLTRAVSQEPTNGAYVDSLGWVYFRQGKLDLAEKYLQDATRLLPRDATVHEHLGDVYAKRGDATKALNVYRHALSLEPEQKDEAKIRSKIAELEKKAAQPQR